MKHQPLGQTVNHKKVIQFHTNNISISHMSQMPWQPKNVPTEVSHMSGTPDHNSECAGVSVYGRMAPETGFWFDTRMWMEKKL